MTVLLVALAHPVMARHHKKAQTSLSESSESFSIATRAYRSGDYATALIHLRSLAEQGHAGAQVILGERYRSGKGVSQDDKEYARWILKAAKQDHAGAIKGWDCFERLPRIKQPTLVLHGAEDVLILPENGRVLAAQIPDARFELIESSGHIPMAEQPHKTVELIRRFLQDDA